MPERNTDDLETLFAVLPPRVYTTLHDMENREDVLEIVLDLGRPPEARFPDGEVTLSAGPITQDELDGVVERVGQFGDDNRAGIGGTLHRISAIRNRRGQVVGLTCRVGREVQGSVAMIRDVIEQGKSILILGRPGVGKTTLLREAARVLADELGKRVVVVDTSNEIAGDGDIPHPGIGRARRMQVARTAAQHAVMIEAVENHMPEVIIIDEIGTAEEAAAARTIAERGVQLVGTAHGRTLENLLVNPTLADLVGGIQAVTLGDEEARRRGTQKTVLERKAPPTFDVLVEQQSWREVIIHKDVADAVDELLRGASPAVLLRTRDEHDHVSTRVISAPNTDTPAATGTSGANGPWSFDERRRGKSGSARQARMLNDPRRQPAGEEVMWAEEADNALAVELAEPTGTSGLHAVQGLVRQATKAPQRKIRIYPFGISRDRLEQSAKQLKVPVEISHDQNNADAVMTLRTFYRRQSGVLREAEGSRKPIYILRSNSTTQMQQCLARIFDLRQSEARFADHAEGMAAGTALAPRAGESGSYSGSGSYGGLGKFGGHSSNDGYGSYSGYAEHGREGADNPVTEAIQEAEDAITRLLTRGMGHADLAPQNSYVRRIQHRVAERYNLESRSYGKEPNRRVKIFAR